MGLSTRLVVGGAVAGVALTYYARGRHQRTGESYLHIVRQLPGDVVRLAETTKARAVKALDEGRTVARERDEEFTLQLTAAGAPPGA